MENVLHEATHQVLRDRQMAYRGKHKKRHWWNSNCLYHRDRQRFWFGLWKTAGKPRTGHVYDCYKLAKKSYRAACRSAVDNGMCKTYRRLDHLRGQHNMTKFWNLVRQTKNTSGSSESDISLDALHGYYSNKFQYDNSDVTETVKEAELKVKEEYDKTRHKIDKDFMMTTSMLTTYVGRLRKGCAAGIDGITAEHLSWSKDTKIFPTLCDMLTLCVRFGLVADSFTKGLLIPLLKKPNIDPAIAKHYRPVVISTTFSKVLEIHLLAMCGEHEFHDLQFGFVESRGTSMAAAMTNDVIDYCLNNGSPVYVCALDAEGAFDGIPHSVMFYKALNAVPMLYWRLLIYWYSCLVVYVRWGDKISAPIDIRKGTRQGGLSSPFIFNLLYQDLVEELSTMNCGVSIGGTTYNLCCYADDLLLCSLTVSGLQHLIYAADGYITQHGLRFNPMKTSCVTFRKSPFPDRCWHLQGTQLTETSEIKHLGVILANNSKSHAEARIQAARRAFYSLQGAGLCVKGCNSETIAHIYNTAIRPVLTYGLECVFQGSTVMGQVEATQSKFLKASLGIKLNCRTSPLLQALNVDKVMSSVEIRKLSLFKSMFFSSSRTNVLYKYLLTCALRGSLTSQKNLVLSVIKICEKYQLSLAKLVMENSYFRVCKRTIKFRPQCGIADSTPFILHTSHDFYVV